MKPLKLVVLINLMTVALHAQNFLNINAASPLSTVAINGDGAAQHTVYINGTKTDPAAAALAVEQVAPADGSTAAFGIRSNIFGGNGYTYGVLGAAVAPAMSNAGRAYGIYGSAGNADVNYGVYGRLTGSDDNGSALFAVDAVSNPSFSEIITGRWAAYLIGNTHVTGKSTIGTTATPANLGGRDLSAYKLFVCGGILADEWLVPNATWCDYVFDADYALLSLPEVAQHIDRTGHLHRTPSATTIEAQGLPIGEITVNQQEKIEEIYLHLIDLDKRMRRLEGENQRLRAENCQLREQIKSSADQNPAP